MLKLNKLNKNIGTAGNLPKRQQSNFLPEKLRSRFKTVHYLVFIMAFLCLVASIVLANYQNRKTATSLTVLSELEDQSAAVKKEIAQLRQQKSKLSAQKGDYLSKSRFRNARDITGLVGYVKAQFKGYLIESISIDDATMSVRLNGITLGDATRAVSQVVSVSNKLFSRGVVEETGQNAYGESYATLSFEFR